jgi:hypothetical protein
MRRLIRTLVWLYPARWRHRYGDEFVSLLDELDPGWRQLFDVVQGAIVMNLRSIRPSVVAGSLGRNVVALVLYWLTGLTLVQIGERLLGGWPASTLGELMALVLGVVLALRLGAKVTAYFLTAMTAYSASLNAIHLYYGIRAAQGAPTHLAVIGAGLIGVMLGALLATHYRSANGLGEAPAETGGPRRDEVDIDRPAVRSERLSFTAGC